MRSAAVAALTLMILTVVTACGRGSAAEPFTVITMKSYAGYKYWFWRSPADRTVPMGQATSMVAILKSAAVPVQLSLLSGIHGDLSRLPPAQIVRFFQA